MNLAVDVNLNDIQQDPVAFDMWLGQALFEFRQRWSWQTNVWMHRHGLPVWPWIPETDTRRASLKKMRRFALLFNRARRGRRQIAVWREVRWGTAPAMALDFMEAFHHNFGPKGI
ncbi:hypothetical protein SISSUDRAFT_1038079 [Sistotremastrum suecicum HHB10207 ss-3]|uniref:Uncharacterized protein n=1 Tax=Sistotremastrum suecicum HHB10207 ss-3 TaxID=1314776 RepID=A0A165X8X3_9AGAM|nr:hypothetical protein SISSUDRAFT_1038079 [Sistotremastrum suecicum HHB10207 ss-3]